MPSPIPFWSGKNAKVVFLFNEAKLALTHVTWSVKRQGEKAQDPVGGEDRDRLQFITTHFDVMIEAKQEQVAQLKAFIKHQEEQDAATLPKESSVGFLIYPNNGTRAAFSAEEYTLDDWEVSSPGRTQRNTLQVPGRSRYFREVPAA